MPTNAGVSIFLNKSTCVGRTGFPGWRDVGGRWGLTEERLKAAFFPLGSLSLWVEPWTSAEDLYGLPGHGTPRGQNQVLFHWGLNVVSNALIIFLLTIPPCVSVTASLAPRRRVAHRAVPCSCICTRGTWYLLGARIGGVNLWEKSVRKNRLVSHGFNP